VNLILLTNDDGIDAPGLFALQQALAPLGKVKVLAPDRNWSSSGHTITLDRPLRIHARRLADGSEAFACDGAPSDCVAVGVLGFFKERPSLVVSGINPTANLAHDMTYSGTVSAAMEAALNDIPSFAISLDRTAMPPDFGAAAAFARRLARKVLREGMPTDTFLNVNIPALRLAAIRGVRITRAGKRIYRDELIERIDPRGAKYYWIGGQAPTGDVEAEGTDLWALANGFISITPVHLDLTSHAMIEKMWDWAEELHHGE
jgi:5'-nucleotidase